MKMKQIKKDNTQASDVLFMFLNSFLQMHNREVTREEISIVIATLHKNIKSGLVIAKHPLATIANQTQDKLVKALNTLKPKERVIVSVTNKKAIERKINTLNGLGFWHIVAGTIVGETAKQLYHKHVSKNKPELNGIEGFTRADDRKEVVAPDTFKLKGCVGKILGNIQPYKYSIVITGDPHAGKTEFVMQLANSFASINKKVGAFMLEQGGLESKDTKGAIDRNVSKENQHNLFVTGDAPKGIETIRDYAKQFEVVLVDSWQKLKVPSSQFDDLRHEFPNTIFIVIFQQNSEGKTRGGIVADYDTPVKLKVHKVDSTFENNYVQVEKNRGNGDTLGFKYLVKAKKALPIE